MSGDEQQSEQVLKEILSSSRKKWQALIDDLVSGHLRLKLAPPTPKDHASDRRRDVNTHASQESFQPPAGLAELEKFTSESPLEPLDTETTFQRDERLHRLTRVMEHLARVEKQNHKVMVVIFALTIWAFLFLLTQVDLFPKTDWFHMTKAISVGSSTEINPKAGSESGPPSAAPVAGNYVGVNTSPEYHDPDCAAVKNVAPKELLPFKSLAAAKRQGYKPCPLCQSPDSP